MWGEKSRPFENAKYIKAEQAPSPFSYHDPAPFFRKEFEIGEKVSFAALSVQTPGFVKVYLNGSDITEDIFISPVSDPQKILWYHTYDVTSLLRKGKNVIGVIAGNGFLNESFKTAWDYDTAPWRDAPQFMLSLCVNSKPVAVSDGTWRASKEASHIVYHHLRSGEWVDMRKYDTRWLLTDYDDSLWRPAVLRERPFGGRLEKTPCQPVRECERIAPVSCCRVENGYLYDFGVNLSGYVDAVLSAPRGTEITFSYAEEIDAVGNPAHNGMDSRYFYAESPFQINRLIASGGEDHFKPLFSYHGFRYLLISGLDAPLREIHAVFTHNDVARRSDFSSGNALLNAIFAAGIRSTYSNMFWCLTDCPTREKLAWLNDAQASVDQTLYHFDILPLYRKWFEDIKAGMHENGLVHGTHPSTDWAWGRDCGPVCGAMLYELPYRVYLHTGDPHMLIDAIPYFVRYADFLTESSETGREFILGDWLGSGNSKRIPKQMVWDFYLYKALRITALALDLAQQPREDIKKRLHEARARFLARYTDCEGRCTVSEQTAVAMMLVEGIYDKKEPLAAQLAEVVLRDGVKMTCGMVGVQYIYKALAVIGRGELAYRMIVSSEPGYKTWFENGATTLWECWDGVSSGSHNHHMFSNVLGWFFSDLLGVSPCEQAPGYRQLTLAPVFVAELSHVSGYIDTVKGRIEASWQYRNGEFVYTVAVPHGVSAVFRGIPCRVGENVFYIKEAEA